MIKTLDKTVIIYYCMTLFVFIHTNLEFSGGNIGIQQIVVNIHQVAR